MGDWWYLIFSDMSDKLVTTYRMAKSPSGPWITPKINNFDGHAFYAAKSASDGEHRYLFGWNCIKNHEKDHDFWQWGGTIIAHEIVQGEDGTLYVKCPQEIRNAYSVPVTLDEGYGISAVEKVTNGWLIGDNARRSLQLLAQMPENCRIELDFTTNKSSYASDLLITDWSGIAYECCFATKRPALFINTQIKCLNPNWEKIGLTPVEITLRDQVGVSVDKERVGECREIAAELFAKADEYEKKITEVLEHHIYNRGRAGEVGANYLLNSLVEKRKKS